MTENLPTESAACDQKKEVGYSCSRTIRHLVAGNLSRTAYGDAPTTGWERIAIRHVAVASLHSIIIYSQRRSNAIAVGCRRLCVAASVH